MIEMLVLTPLQADAVSGETSPGNRLEPVELITGEFALPCCVLDDEAHAAVAAQLAALTMRDVALEEFPAEDDG